MELLHLTLMEDFNSNFIVGPALQVKDWVNGVGEMKVNLMQQGFYFRDFGTEVKLWMVLYKTRLSLNRSCTKIVWPYWSATLLGKVIENYDMC